MAKKIQDANIGIVGNGFVGSAMVSGFLLHVNQIFIYDANPKKSTHTLSEVIEGSNIIFLCLPTPMDEKTGKIDLSIMDNVIQEINNMNFNKREKVFVIKSTVVPGTIESYAEKYKELAFVFNPEFLTERKARLDFINTARIVLGGHDMFTSQVEDVYRIRFPHTQIIKTDFATAQLIKYMANCFFATKVSFMNEMKQICDTIDGNWDDAIKGFITDGRIGNSHIDVPGHDGDFGFGGKCFPKDLNAMIVKAKQVGVNPTILQAAWDKNVEVRKNLDWYDIPGAVTKGQGSE